jgi:predicted nucleic acid-binding protein
MKHYRRVFLDTCVVKHSIRRRTRLQRSEHSSVYEIVEEDPTARVRDEPLRTEIDLLSKVAECAKRGDIELLWHIESLTEFLGIYSFPGGGSSELIEVGVTNVKEPIDYNFISSPLQFPFNQTSKTSQIKFLKNIKHERYLELRKACGANQGTQVRENQLLDAFHIWCAEHAGATHFLTTDFKLIRVVHSYKTAPPQVRVVTPSELLAEIAKDSTASI